ncbi:patatin-like phospholipase family protein [Parachitinimonas caeni]|uniref:Patatin-like phospholipase family protein n=1 Tax=Parachitinimonas caeni TaxID=3031301 RepID=A0ABT7DRL5_9NEIS|nr:patatin-like phospholipase family protein [Parachitinimonas caeni]MDK2122701.1 patatin-like phospholipase family protein [Parachitinimonas caeni]
MDMDVRGNFLADVYGTYGAEDIGTHSPDSSDLESSRQLERSNSLTQQDTDLQIGHTAQALHIGVEGGGTTLAAGIGQRHVGITALDNGKVELTLDRPPVRQLVFAGGGAKGNAYPGAISALEESGVLQGVKALHGASAGAITTSLLACGLTAKEFNDLSDNLEFKKLIGGVVEHGTNFKGALKGLKPGNDFQAPAEGLEKEIRHQARVAVLNRLVPRCQVGDLSPSDQTKLEAVRDKLLNDGAVTFGDLKLLSQHIPEIKELHMTGTAGDKHGNSALVVFNAESSPDMDIAKAAHISGAFPLAFRQVEHTLDHGGTYKFQDGGVMLNIPVPEIINPALEQGPLPNPDKIILAFQGEGLDKLMKGEDTTKKGGLGSRIEDMVTSTDTTASKYFEKRELARFKDQIVPVRLINEHGNFTGRENGTLNFDMSLQARQALQRDLHDDVLNHLMTRNEQPIRAQFDSVPQALFALDATEFNELAAAGDALPIHQAVAEVANFRRDAQAAVDNLATEAAILTSTGKPLLPTMSPLVDHLATLNALAGDDPAKIEHLARVLNQPGNPALAGTMESLKNIYRQNGPVLQKGLPAIHAAVQEGIRRDVKVAASNLIREHIYPARMRHVSPSDHNIQILDRAEAMLRKAETHEDINQAMQLVKKSYQKSWTNPFSSSTISTASQAQNQDWGRFAEAPQKVAQRAINEIVLPALGIPKQTDGNKKILEFALQHLKEAITPEQVNAGLKIIIDNYQHRGSGPHLTAPAAVTAARKLMINTDN